MTNEELKKQAFEKLHEAEKAIHDWATSEEVGPTRNYAFNLYDIVRTSPREATP